jgi:DNA-binding CsgD family transcriptional regulator
MSLAKLTAADLRQLVESGWVVQEIDASEELARHAQNVLHRMIGADMVVWNELTADGKVSTGMTFPDPGDEFWARTAPGMLAHIHEHPFVQHLSASSIRRFTAAISDLLPTRRFVETGLYHHGYREFAAKFQISSAMDTAGGDYLVISLNRRSSDFSGRDKAILDCVTRQAGRAYRMLRRLDDLESRLRARAPGQSRSDGTWLYFDPRFIITWGAPGLGDFLREHFGLTQRDLYLPPVLAKPVRAALSARDNLALAEEHRPVTQTLRHGDRCYQVILERQRGGLYRLMIALIGHSRPPDTTGVLHAPLSRRELEVAHWVAQAKTNPEIAIILGISSRTVEKHVHAALAKFGFENRVQLARCFDGGRTGA